MTNFWLTVTLNKPALNIKSFSIHLYDKLYFSLQNYGSRTTPVFVTLTVMLTKHLAEMSERLIETLYIVRQ